MTEQPKDNAERLRAHIQRLGWSQRQMAEWLSAHGDRVPLTTLEGWLARPGAAHKSRCPSWPITLIESHKPAD